MVDMLPAVHALPSRAMSLSFLDCAEDAELLPHDDLMPSAEDAVYDLVCQLSAACKANCNVLVDNELVDQLETRGRALLQARGRSKSPSVVKMLQLTSQQASRYDTMPENSFYVQQKPSCDGTMDLVLPVSLKSSPECYSPPLEAFRLDDPVHKPNELAMSSASTFSTASMAQYDDADDSDDDYADSVMTLSPFSTSMSMLELRKLSNGSEASASRVLPYDDFDPCANDAHLMHTLQDQIDMLLLENCQIVAENARLAEISDMTAAELEMLAAEKMSVGAEQESVAEKIRAEMRAEFEAELAARTQEVSSLQSEVAGKNSEISRLSQQVEAISVAMENHDADQDMENAGESNDVDGLIATLRKNNIVKETEILEMQETLLQKDREICSLYMHLSTKKKLIEEITRSFVENMAQVSSSESADEIRFDVDTCLFKSVVDKEKRLNQLTAALSAMEQEVEALESRIAAKELEKHTFQSRQQLLSRTLQGMKAKLTQVLAEKGELDAALSASQARIAALMDTLAQKNQKLEEYSSMSGLAPMTTV